MIQEQYVSFETAKLLKEKGFCQDLPYFYNENGEIVKNNYDLTKVYPYISQSLAMRWLREKFNYVINIDLDSYVEGYDPMGYYIVINQYGAPYREVSPTFIDRPDLIFFKTYEEAAEEAIKYVLQVLI